MIGNLKLIYKAHKIKDFGIYAKVFNINIISAKTIEEWKGVCKRDPYEKFEFSHKEIHTRKEHVLIKAHSIHGE